MTLPATRIVFPIEDEWPSGELCFSRVLTVDIGGSNIKVLASGQTEPRKRRSRRNLPPPKMVKTVQELQMDGTMKRSQSVIPDWSGRLDRVRSPGTWAMDGSVSIFLPRSVCPCES